MKIFNCTTTNGGGGVQNAVNFIKNIYLTNKESEWFLFLSHSVFEEVKSIENISNFKVFQSPARSLTARSEILKFQKELNANIVYTSAGPAYVNFTCEHIMGCSNPFILNIGNSNKINLSSPLKSAIRYLNTCYQNFNIKKADYWVFQTEYTKRLFTKKNIDENKCFVVHNAVSNSFREYSEKVLVDDEKINISHNKTIKIIFPSAYYKHKNFEILPKVVAELEKRKIDVTISLTVQDDSKLTELKRLAEELNVKERFINLGGYAHEDALDIYTSHDLVIQPSLLEVFSTTYIESIYSYKPLVVADLPFAHDICLKYPHYFTANDFCSFADAIEGAVFERRDTSFIINQRKLVLDTYGDQGQRFQKISELLHNLIINNRKESNI